VTTTAYGSIIANNLEEIQMYAGDEADFSYNVYDSASALLPLAGATVGVNIFRYGDPSYVTVYLPGVISASPLVGNFTANFPSSSSINLTGVYTQQPTVIDYQGKKHIPGQGKIIIFPSPST
jgi:hypothetical protein